MQKTKRRKSSGQGVVEYGFCIAFVTTLIAVAFHLTQGGLFAGISGSYSAVNNNLGDLNKVGNNGLPQ